MDGLYASLSSFAGIKTTCTPMKQHNSKKVMFIFSLHIHILSERVYVIVVKFIGGLCSRCKIYIGGGGGGGGIMSTSQNSRGIMSTYTKIRGGGCPGDFALHSVE